MNADLARKLSRGDMISVKDDQGVINDIQISLITVTANNLVLIITTEGQYVECPAQELL